MGAIKTNTNIRKDFKSNFQSLILSNVYGEKSSYDTGYIYPMFYTVTNGSGTFIKSQKFVPAVLVYKAYPSEPENISLSSGIKFDFLIRVSANNTNVIDSSSIQTPKNVAAFGTVHDNTSFDVLRDPVSMVGEKPLTGNIGQNLAIQVSADGSVPVKASLALNFICVLLPVE